MATPDSTPHEYIDAELTLEGLSSPSDEQELLRALAGREGIRSVSFSAPKLELEYEPVLIHKTQIVAVIEAAGFRVAGIETASASPIVDAIFEEAEHRSDNTAPSPPPP